MNFPCGDIPAAHRQRRREVMTHRHRLITASMFATNWKAEAEHGGFYQAVADGTYAKYGLEVTIRAGGPQSNERALLPAGKVEFIMGGNMNPAFNAVQEGIPTRVVAAVMQKDPQVFLSHP